MNLGKRFSFVVSMMAMVVASMLWGVPAARAADHRDAPTIDGIPEADLTDIFAFLDPNDSGGGTMCFIMNVNPFSLGAETPSYRFGTDLLYQFHVDNDGDAVDELVIQIEFFNTSSGVQMFNLWGPRKPESVKNVVPQPKGKPDLTGALSTLVASSDNSIKVWAGQFDDPFVFDIGQFFRINGKADQDVFRGFTSPVLGMLRGRPTRNDGTSGVDGFGGFNLSSIQVEVPTAKLLGKSAPVINVWGTVSRPVSTMISERSGEHFAKRFTQVDRMGQQVFNTVFAPASMKDMVNSTVPSDDVKNYSVLVPDALTTTDNDTTGNTVAGRASLLQSIGVTSSPNGAPLLPSGVGGSPIYSNTTKDLLRLAILPDFLRIDTSILPPNDAPTPSTIGAFANSANKTTVGYQNGRRPGDAVADILLLLARQLADIHFPTGSGVPGSGPVGSRHALLCDNAQFPECSDRRILTVLQGTDFIKPDNQLTNLTVSGNDLPLSTTFPFLAKAHPLPGEPGTINYPPQM
jgi:hypothetical protein